ncbi:MAG TPA: hypothetical protein VKS22_16100 [Candidatus Binataceae bacterium]|nr:hypothetical protein [Candidatus Binataceae bacterium]
MFDIKEYREVCERIGKLSSDLEKLETRRVDLEKQMQAPAPSAARSTNGAPMSTQGRPQPRQFDPDAPPDLRHTKLQSAQLGGMPISGKTNWKTLLVAVVRLAKTKAGNDHAQLQRFLAVPFVVGRKETDGYRFLSDVGLSVQGQDANHAWRYTLHTARQLGIAVEVEFVWRSKDGAAYPGETGRLSA